MRVVVACPQCSRLIAAHRGRCPFDGHVFDSNLAMANASTVRHRAINESKSSRPNHVGRKLGVYRLVEIIGRGGMGTVYRAVHSELEHEVAIKVIDRHLEDSKSQMRFFREARAAAKIKHENIIQVIDFASDPQVGSYMVMELLRGRSLEEVIAAEAPMPEERALALTIHMAQALSAAHRIGVVHRDLKPANAFVTVSRGKDVVKVMDFGIAKVAESLTDPMTPTSEAGLGTPLYMSPEQWAGGDVDARSDVFALGLILYEMVTGEVPSAGAGLIEIARKVAEEIPRPPREIEPEISAELDAVILRCLEKRPSKRYPDMDGLTAALRALLPKAEVRRASPRLLAPWTAVAIVASCAAAAFAAWPLVAPHGSTVQSAAPNGSESAVNAAKPTPPAPNDASLAPPANSAEAPSASAAAALSAGPSASASPEAKSPSATPKTSPKKGPTKQEAGNSNRAPHPHSSPPATSDDNLLYAK